MSEKSNTPTSITQKMSGNLGEKKILYYKLKPVHSTKVSLLSTSSGFENYRGLMNLCLLLLVLSNFRLALENILKYGVLVDKKIVWIFLEDPYRWPSVLLCCSSNLFIQMCYQTEKALSRGDLTEKVGFSINMFTVTCLIVCPMLVSHFFSPVPWFLTLASIWHTVVILKIISYASVNKWCREEKARKIEDSEFKPVGPVVYPNNLTQKDMYYFLLAPTFCYELNFPQTQKINKIFLIKRIAEFVFLVGFIIALFQQWIVPTVQHSFEPIEMLDYARMFERLMKLAIPNHLLWLMFFYMYFHCFLNIVAEILYFGDRTFYMDWWNAPNISYFWQNWNIPIHHWAKRHVYLPMLRSNYTKISSSIFVFFISAFFHEFIVAVPLKMFKPWAFFAMLGQIPLAVITHYMGNPWGNVVVWLSLIMGQPLAILMYYHEYYMTHYVVRNETVI